MARLKSDDVSVRISGADENNLKHIDADFSTGLTVVTGVSGSGKSSLVFDTLYQEARRHFMELFVGARAPQNAPVHAQRIDGLAPTVAIGQDLLNRNPGSTVATFSGLFPFLRLLYVHYGQRYCARCGEPMQTLPDEDLVARVRDATSIAGQLVTEVVGSHETLLVSLVELVGQGRLRVDGRLYNQDERLDGKRAHTIQISFEAVEDTGAARRLVDDCRSLGVDVMVLDDQTVSMSDSCVACGEWFAPLDVVHFKTPCISCAGRGGSDCANTGLHPAAASVRWQGFNLTRLSELTIDAVAELVESAPPGGYDARLYLEMKRRLDALQTAGLGYLALNRPAPSLSRGEGQRIRLAVVLTSRLQEIIHILDEPTIGLHAADVQRLMPAFRDLPGPVIYVEHDRIAAATADWCIDIGPGAGARGGNVSFAGSPAALWQSDTITGRYFSLREAPSIPLLREQALDFITVHDAGLHNLQHVTARFARGRLNVVTGVSGSGKSTLVTRVLAGSLGNEPTGCREVTGAGLKPLVIDQSPIGKNPRSNPATYTKLAEVVRTLFANVSGLSPSHFTFNRKEGACPECEGMGAIEVGMRFLPSAWLTCSVCQGARFTEEVLTHMLPVNDRELNISDFLELSVTEAKEVFDSLEGDVKSLTEEKRRTAVRLLEALNDIGLGYLALGQSSPSLSGGEAQRVKLAKHLGGRNLKDKLLILDEPTTGLHPSDVSGLLVILDRLVRQGATIIVVEHNLDVVKAADWIVDMGPGSGPSGGRVVYEGPFADLRGIEESVTARAIADDTALTPSDPIAKRAPCETVICIRGAKANNLDNVDVDIPKGKLTAVTGISGSGKSSLVRDVLEVEARRRYLESLSMYERQGFSEGVEAKVDSVQGLGVTLPLAAGRRFRNPRLTVGTATDMTHHLAALLSRLGDRRCPDCDDVLERVASRWCCPRCHDDKGRLPEPRHFIANIYGSACLTCQGMGALRQPNVDKLIIAPEKPLCAGAMYSPGFYPQGYYGKPFNGGYDLLQALAAKYDFDPFETPWQDMPDKARQAFLFGDDAPMQVTFVGRNGHTRKNTERFHGIFEILGAWDQGGTYTDPQVCPDCGGGRLRPENLAVTLNGRSMHELCSMPIATLIDVCKKIQTDALTRPPLVQVQTRIQLLVEMGLGYLHLDRRTATLSVGEAQRLGLAKVIASGLQGLTVLLDEPSRGMHPREVDALINMLRRIREQGNTAIVVEHDPDIILAADHIIDVGPGAGKEGGRIVASGTPAAVRRNAKSATARMLNQRRPARDPLPLGEAFMTIRGAMENNLQIESLKIPLGCIVGVCGVSGSGKSTLIMDTLARVVAPRKHTTSVAQESITPGEHNEISGYPPRCILVDQAAEGIGSPALFLGLIRAMTRAYAQTSDAVALGLDEKTLVAPCGNCRGQGTIRIDMGFLPPEESLCESCAGSGYREEAGHVWIGGISFAEVFKMTVREALAFWEGTPKMATTLQLLCDVGLGYLVLNQPARTLSGGEAQRLKICKELMKAERSKNPSETLYLLDEPAAGLHLADLQALKTVLFRLRDQGASIIVVEHHMDLLVDVDWLIELGPVGGPEGGRVIAEGTPLEVSNMDTPTAPYLKRLLEA